MRISQDLRQRAKSYASGIVRLFRDLPPRDKAIEILGLQLLRSGTSVAAHTREASRARSDAEFCSKLDGLLQEADESELWLELLMEDCEIDSERAKFLHKETNELIGIFTTIVSKVRRNLD
jgi:four helix bundle protein